MVPDEINVYLWREGFHLFFPMRGTDHWRVVGSCRRSCASRDDLTFEEVVPSVRQEAGSGLSFQRCTWFSTYRIHHRRAARFRDRRCFLLGDAAHIHSPVGAQGMNTGLQDAYNLAWKLALVVSGRAEAALLDSYEDERIPVARRLLSTTDRAFSLVVSDNSGGDVAYAGPGQTRGVRDELRERSNGLPFAPFRRPGFVTPTAVCRKRCRACLPRRALATGFPGCGSSSRRMARARICSKTR